MELGIEILTRFKGDLLDAVGRHDVISVSFECVFLAGADIVDSMSIGIVQILFESQFDESIDRIIFIKGCKMLKCQGLSAETRKWSGSIRMRNAEPVIIVFQIWL